MNELPKHLQADQPPEAVCDRCRRKSWADDAVGHRCGMLQPDGMRCAGTFREWPYFFGSVSSIRAGDE